MGVTVREKTPGSGVWWLFVNHHGYRKSKLVGTETAARDAAAKIEARLVLGEFSIIEKETNKMPLFKDYATKWLFLPHDWKEATLRSYEATLGTYVLPKLGKYRLDEIKRGLIKAFLDDLLGELSASSVGVIRSILGGVLGYALDSELIDTNPVHGLKIQGKKRSDFGVDPLTEKEAEKLLSRTEQYHGGQYHAPLLCALRTGMRIGEIQALAWGDIDFNGRFIEVRRSWRQGRTTETKNRKRRRVDMSPKLADTLRALRVVQKKRAFQHGRPVSEWVFADKVGNMMCREAFRRALNKCLELEGIRRIRIHDLRHSYATIRLLRGHNVGDVSYQLGHSSISITYDVYGHWMPGKFKNEVDELDTLHPAAPQAHPGAVAGEIL